LGEFQKVLNHLCLKLEFSTTLRHFLWEERSVNNHLSVSSGDGNVESSLTTNLCDRTKTWRELPVGFLGERYGENNSLGFIALDILYVSDLQLRRPFRVLINDFWVHGDFC
jgi:hypothetical protein